MYFFFFKQKTAYEMRISDWSSDVCSSDLVQRFNPIRFRHGPRRFRQLPFYHCRGRFSSQIQRGNTMHDRTLCVKRPEVSHAGFASLAIPTYRASTIVFDSAEAYASRSKRGPDGYTYGLHGTPTSRTLEGRSEVHKSELQSIMRSSYAVFCLKKKTHT